MENFRESLRYIRLDFANRVFVNLWSRVIVSWSKRLTPIRVLNGQVSWEVLGREYFPRKYWNRQVLKWCFMHFSLGYLVKIINFGKGENVKNVMGLQRLLFIFILPHLTPCSISSYRLVRLSWGKHSREVQSRSKKIVFSRSYSL